MNINQSHGGSSKQALSVAAGLDADVVTMNQATDIDLLAEKGLVASPTGRKKFPNGAAPFTTVQVFLVRKGNPKNIKDWDDLVKPGVASGHPQSQTDRQRPLQLSGWLGFSVIKKGGTEAQAREYITKLFKNVPVLDSGGRAASVTFTQRGIGDVLVTFENEVKLLTLEHGSDKFDVVYPSITILAEPPDRRGREGCGQARYAQDRYRVSELPVLGRRPVHRCQELLPCAQRNHRQALRHHVSEDRRPSRWMKSSATGQKAQKTHFADGGIFDQIYTTGK